MLGELEDVRRVDVLHVERRVLAHQEHVELLEPAAPGAAEREPLVGVVADLHVAPRAERPAVADQEILLAEVNERPAAPSARRAASRASNPSSA